MYEVSRALVSGGSSITNLFYYPSIDGNWTNEANDVGSYLFHHGCSPKNHDNFDAKQLVTNLEFVPPLEGNECLKNRVCM